MLIIGASVSAYGIAADLVPFVGSLTISVRVGADKRSTGRVRFALTDQEIAYTARPIHPPADKYKHHPGDSVFLSLPS